MASLADIVVKALREEFELTDNNRADNAARIVANDPTKPPQIYFKEVGILVDESDAFEKEKLGLYISPVSRDAEDAQVIANGLNQRVTHSLILFLVYSGSYQDDLNATMLDGLLDRIRDFMYKLDIYSGTEATNPNHWDPTSDGFTYGGGELGQSENGNFVWQDTWRTTRINMPDLDREN